MRVRRFILEVRGSPLDPGVREGVTLCATSQGANQPAKLGADEAVTLIDWRRSVGELYAGVRREPDPKRGHAHWRRGRDELFRTHPQSPLAATDALRRTGVAYFPYDPSMRFVVPLRVARRGESLTIQTASDGQVLLELVGHVTIPELGIELDAWWLAQYGGGLFLPLRDGTAGTETYGGGRYLLDTAKGADLGDHAGKLILDLNFLYHPSCRYNSAWDCPLAPEGNTTEVRVLAGERI
jgi:uncharacterized protein (DUF1684 family)